MIILSPLHYSDGSQTLQDDTQPTEPHWSGLESIDSVSQEEAVYSDVSYFSQSN